MCKYSFFFYIMLTYDHVGNSSLFLYHTESLVVFSLQPRTCVQLYM